VTADILQNEVAARGEY